MESSLRTQPNQESEITLTEVVYSDRELIDSLDAQLRKGTLDNEQYEHSKHKATSAGGGANFWVVWNANAGHERAATETSIRVIKPHDFKVQTLVAELGIEIHGSLESMPNDSDGRLVIVYGDVRLFSIPRLAGRISKAENMHILDHLVSNVYNGRTGADSWMNGMSQMDVVKRMLDFLPQGPSAVISLDDGETLLLPFVESNLRYPLDVLFNEFPGGFMGMWVVFGILRPMPRLLFPNNEDTENVTLLDACTEIEFAAQQAVYTAGYPQRTMTPIHIYKGVGTYTLQSD